jgi:hypothetical protein
MSGGLAIIIGVNIPGKIGLPIKDMTGSLEGNIWSIGMISLSGIAAPVVIVMAKRSGRIIASLRFRAVRTNAPPIRM